MFSSAILGPYKDTAELVGLCDVNQTRMDYYNGQFVRNFDIPAVPTYKAEDFAKMLREQKVDTVIVTTVEAGDDRQALQAAVKTVCDNCPKAAVMLLSVVEPPSAGEGGKVAIICQVPSWAQQKGLKAGDWLRDAAAIVGGKGGGKPDSAQGGGTDTAKVKDVIAHARSVSPSC